MAAAAASAGIVHPGPRAIGRVSFKSRVAVVATHGEESRRMIRYRTDGREAQSHASELAWRRRVLHVT